MPSSGSQGLGVSGSRGVRVSGSEGLRVPLCVSAGVRQDPAVPVERAASGLAGLQQLPVPAGVKQLVLPEQQPADPVLRQPQPLLRLL